MVANNVKVGIFELNGQELDQVEEYDLKVRDLSDNNLDSIADGEVPTWDSATQKFIPGSGSSGGGGEAACESFTQASHGLAVGNAVRYAAGAWVKAQANTGVNSEVIALVSEVADANNFTVCYSGRVNGLSGLTPDCVYFLSDATAGGLTDISPVISKPILFATSATSAIILIMRAMDADTGNSGLEVEDDGSSVTVSAKKINFKGSNFIITEPVADEVDVELVSNAPYFGNRYQYAFSDPDSTNATTTFATKVSLTTPSLPAGTYRIGYTFNPGVNSNGIVAEYRVRRDTTVINESSFEADNDRHDFAGFNQQILTAGVHTFDIQYRTTNVSGGALIRAARLEFWRIE